jgi:hypothetical protein
VTYDLPTLDLNINSVSLPPFFPTACLISLEYPPMNSNRFHITVGSKVNLHLVSPAKMT